MRALAPSPAERARTAVRQSPSLIVRTASGCGEVDLHGCDPGGAVVLVVAEDHPVVTAVRRADDDIPVLVDATDLCPVPVADRVRARARLAGWVHEPPEHLRRELAVVVTERADAGAVLDIGRGRTVLYVEVAEAMVVDGGVDLDESPTMLVVDDDEYATALPDPLADVEAELLGHLHAGHRRELGRLAELLPAAARPATGVVPVRLDRYGLVLRATLPSAVVDARLPFDAPLHRPEELPGKMRELLSRAAYAGPDPVLSRGGTT